MDRHTVEGSVHWVVLRVRDDMQSKRMRKMEKKRDVYVCTCE